MSEEQLVKSMKKCINRIENRVVVREIGREERKRLEVRDTD